MAYNIRRIVILQNEILKFQKMISLDFLIDLPFYFHIVRSACLCGIHNQHSTKLTRWQPINGDNSTLTYFAFLVHANVLTCKCF